ncbi:MAG TPA: membrane protein insertion efficiency factor YidD [Thermoanaerobaculia bacterium]|nr:membrane protein insertion efficiency factor YidD [Thermoanaerobaculia bacterium]
MEQSRRRRLKRWGIVLAILLAVGLDLARAPENQLSARVLLGAIDLYQATLSPRMGSFGVQCRFKPTCSHYGEGAIRKYGAWTGSWRAVWRIGRCGPWTPAGTVDPP